MYSVLGIGYTMAKKADINLKLKKHSLVGETSIKSIILYVSLRLQFITLKILS